jgi:hypothetical protein
VDYYRGDHVARLAKHERKLAQVAKARTVHTGEITQVVLLKNMATPPKIKGAFFSLW